MPLPSSGIIVVEKPYGSIKAAGTVSHQLQNRSQQQQAHQHQHVVSAAASSSSSIKISASSASSNLTTALLTTSPYIEYNESNNVRVQQHLLQQTEQEHQQQQRTQLQLQYQKSSAYAHQQNAFVEQIGNNSSNSCNTSGGAVSTTALKQQRRPNFNFTNLNSGSISSSFKKNTNNNCNNLGHNNSASINYTSKTGVLSGSGSYSATASSAATSGIHKIQIKTQQTNNSSSAQNQQSQTQSQHQAPPQHQPQLIQLSEELFEQAVNSSCDVNDAVNGSKSNMILSTTSEMINQQQVYKIVAADGTTSNMIIDNLGNVTPTGGGGVAVSSGATANVVVNNTATVAAPSNTSKVLLGNLTVLSKHHHINNAVTSAAAISTPSISSISCSTSATGQQQQQHPQTINFVSAKNLSYLATVASVSGTGTGSTTPSATTSYGSIAGNANIKQKFALSSSPYKNSTKQHPQTSSSTATTFLLQQQQKLSTSGTTATVPVSVTTRPVQMMTRVQTLMQPSSAAGSTVLQQQQQQQPQLLLQHAQAKHITSSNKLHNNNSLINTGSTGSFKKSSISSSGLKMPTTNKLSTLATASSVVHHHTVASSGLGVKTAFIPQQQQQHQHQQYQSTNSLIASGSSGIGVGISVGSGNIAKTKSSSKLIKQYNNAINNSASSLSTYTINQQKFNNNSQLQNTTSTTKITKLSNKYILHQPQAQQTHPGHLQQHIVNLPHGTQLQHKGVLPTSVATSQNHFNTSTSITSGGTSTTTIYQHLSGSSNTGSGGTGNNTTIAPTGTIKFVNAHGTVIQQHPGTQALALHSQTATTAVTTTTATVAAMSSATIAPAMSTPTPTPSSSSSSTSAASLFADDIVIVNGTQMTDELSARILQSMSQKSYNNSQHRYHQQQKLSTGSSNCGGNGNAGGNMPPPTTNILLTPKEYQLYNPVQSAVSNVAVSQQQPSLLAPSAASTSCLSASVSPFMQQHSAVVSSATTSFVTPGSTGNVGAVPVSPVSISYVATPSSLGTTASTASNSRQVYSATGSRSHSMERKFNDNSLARKNLDLYKISNNGLAGSAVRSTAASGTINSITTAPMEQLSFQHALPQQHQPHTQVIHLQTLKTTSSSSTMSTSLPASAAMLSNAASGTNDDDIIGEEIRPVPVITQDVRLQILHAVLSDHTYANAMPTRLPTDFNVQQMLLQQQAGIAGISAVTSSNNANLLTKIVATNNNNSVNSSSNSLNSNVSQYVTSLSATSIGNITSSPTAAVTTQQWALGGITSSIATMANSQQHQQLVHSSYTTIYGQSIPRLQQQDDDAHSAISNGSRAALGDIDPGEETETAPEAEAEDDSITRCICDLTHDDGYMICCDKCSAWQHVDCMGIDRSNIPDEYLCELCQPRTVNKSRARALQILKRKQQSQAVLSAQANAAGNPAIGGVLAGVDLLSYDSYLSTQQRIGGMASSSGAGSSSNLSNLSASEGGALHTLSNAALGIAGSTPYLSGNSYTTKKSKFLKKTKDLVVGTAIMTAGGRKSKKAEKQAAAAASAAGGGGCVGNISSPNTSGKALRKETRKNTKRKTKTSVAGGESSSSGGPGANTAAGKHAANLRHWIENYELAVTNHYSPELRARLHAITKQPSLLQSIINTENKALKDCGNLENRATTVPHAGGKILISNLDIGPNYPIFELRGKYMLTTQYKTQNPSVNMNMPPPSNYQLIASHKAHKTPGPFIFFYQLPGAEAPMQTMNPDGSYPPVPPQPAYLKGPEICVDTRTYGNEARFVRRSCRPNAEIQHLFEKGTIHLFLVSLTTIRASTEITIRHEPHDMQAVESRKSNALIVKPTSTACACGLTNDCLFGPPLPKLPPSAAKPGRKSTQLRSDKKAFQSSAALQLTAANPNILSSSQVVNASKKKSVQNLNRNRSTSSSGDSNMGSAAGFQSPNIAQMHLGGTIMVGGTAANSNLKTMSLNNMAPNNNILALSGCGNSTSSMHDSGICTSSSSPSVSIPSPTPQHIHSPTQQQHQQQQQQQTTVLQRTLIMQQQNPQHQQMLASLPATMLLSPQLQPQQQQTQPPLAVITTAPSSQLPVDVISGEGNNDNVNGKMVENQSQQLQQYSDKTVPSQQQSNVEKTLAAAAALQSLNSVEVMEKPSPLEPQKPEQVEKEEKEEKEPILPAKAAIPSESLENLEFTLPQSAQKRQRHPSGSSAHQRQVPSKPPQGPVASASASVSVSVQSNDVSIGNIDTSTASTSTPVKGAQKQQHQQNIAGTRKSSGGIKHARNASDAVMNTSSGTDPHTSQYKNSDTSSSDMTATPATNSTIQASSSATAATLTSTPKEKPKLSREDRKMEAILRAIEIMERTQQRKKESKASKGLGKRRQNEASKRAAANSSGEFGDGPNVSSSLNQTVKRATHATRKKKRKTSKSYGGANGMQRKRHKSRMSSNDSDVDADADCAAATSESEGNSLLSPNITVTSHLTQQTKQSATETTTTDSLQQQSVDQAAGLLMALASHNVENKSVPTPIDSSFKSPQRGAVGSANVSGTPHSGTSEPAGSPPATPPAPVSSACLLIEAAVAPLDAFVSNGPEFKYPSKAKTKKSLMSNWLHQSEVDSSQPLNTANSSVAAGGLDSLVQAAMCDYNPADQTKQEPAAACPEDDSPQNLSVAAMKVEEFIYQTERSSSPMAEVSQKNATQHQLSSIYMLEGTSCAVADQQQQHQSTMGSDLSASSHSGDIILNAVTMSSTAVRNLNLPLHQVSTCSNNSSVKKRWLRQAISEETDDTGATLSPLNALTPQSVSPAGSCGLVMPNGFTTPLKKRRLVINKDEDIESDGGGSGGSAHLQTGEPDSAAATPTNEHNEIDISINNDYDKQVQYHYLSARSTESLMDNIKSEEELEIDDENIEEDDMEAESEIVDVGSELHHPTNITDQLLVASPKRSRIGEVKTEALDNASNSPPLPRTKAASKQFVDSTAMEETKHEIKTDLSHLTDQDDDVDILRSPSPGQKIVAEDNLVKIEPEDVSGGEDVKIDVEREESLATDNFEEIVSGMKTKKEQHDIAHESKAAAILVKEEDVKLENVPGEECKKVLAPSAENVNNDKKFLNSESSVWQAKDTKVLTKTEDPTLQRSPKKLGFKSANEADEPLEKKPKLCDNDSPCTQEDASYPATATAASSCQSNEFMATQQLSDDDIQDRLSLFHQENILLLQTRNKQQPEPVPAGGNDVGGNVTVTPDYNKFELDTVKPSPPSPSLQHHPYAEISPIVSSSVGKTPLSSSKNLSKQSSSSTYSSSSKKTHKRDRERDRDRDRERDREHRDRDRGRERSRQRERGRQRERNRSYDRSRDRERGRSYNRSYERDREFRLSRDRSYERNRSRDRSYDYSHDHSRDRSYERNRSRDQSRERSRERTGSSSSSYYYNNKTSGNTTATSYSASSNSHNSYTGHYNSSSGTTHSTPTASAKKGSQSSTSSKSSKKALSSSASNTSAVVVPSVANALLATHIGTSSEKTRYRTTSGSSTGGPTNLPLPTPTATATVAATPTATPPSLSAATSGNRKRLNFEQENTQTSGKHHRRDDRGKEYKDEASNIATPTSNISTTGKRRSRDDGSMRSTYTPQRSLSSSSTSTTSVSASTSAGSVSAPVTSNSCSPVYPIPVISSGTAATVIPVVEPMQAQQLTSVHVTYPPPQTVRIVREHPTIPHFNNPLTVISPGQDVFTSSKTSNYSENAMTTSTPTTTTLLNNNNCSTNSLATNPTPLPSASSFSGAFNSHQPTASSQLPFYNTVYGKLLDHITPPVILPTSNVAVTAATQPTAEENTSSSALSTQKSVFGNSASGANIEHVPTGNATSGSDVSMSNYFDAKLKSYSTLSGYVSHSALFGLGNTPKLSSSSNSNITGTHAPAVLSGTSDSTASFNSLDGIISSSTSATLGKLSMLTKTASHDPRLNPILSAPEPPSVPKRKLSINEYRRRMKQSASSSSSLTESSNSAATTPTTPDIPSTATASAAITTATTTATAPLSTSSSFFEDGKAVITAAAISGPTISRCTLNSPERLDGSSGGCGSHRNTSSQKTLEKSETFSSAKGTVSGLYSGIDSPPATARSSIEEDLKKGQFNAAPTLLEKQQEKLCERLKSLKSQQSILKASPTAALECGRTSSSSFLLDRSSALHINNIGSVNNVFDNCFEAISSTSTSLESSRTSSPEQNFTTKGGNEKQKEAVTRKQQQQTEQQSTSLTGTAALDDKDEKQATVVTSTTLTTNQTKNNNNKQDTIT